MIQYDTALGLRPASCISARNASESPADRSSASPLANASNTMWAAPPYLPTARRPGEPPGPVAPSSPGPAPLANPPTTPQLRPSPGARSGSAPLPVGPWSAPEAASAACPPLTLRRQAALHRVFRLEHVVAELPGHEKAGRPRLKQRTPGLPLQAQALLAHQAIRRAEKQQKSQHRRRKHRVSPLPRGGTWQIVLASGGRPSSTRGLSRRRRLQMPNMNTRPWKDPHLAQTPSLGRDFSGVDAPHQTLQHWGHTSGRDEGLSVLIPS
eukprot:scaffold624_cov214-Pinguiococcus_pyrenoidosus.AAC.8